MLRNEADRVRPILVFALTLNLFFGTFLNIFMKREGGFLPWKYDHVLFLLDRSLGISAASIAIPLQGVCRAPLGVVYQALVPLMVCWIVVYRYRNPRGSVALAYAAELVAGPLLYALFPACGPIYAFGPQWLHPPAVQPDVIRLSAMPNAFPSLHIATALIFVLLPPGRFWKPISLAFLIATGLATISTGEHYVIDLVSGLAFGCFAASVGYRRIRSALLYLGLVLSWSLAARFGYSFLIAHPPVTRIAATLTVLVVTREIVKEWRLAPTRADNPAHSS
jgi:hypothetical protein